VPGRGPERADCVASRVQRLVPDALVVHRLDMATSGLLLMARGPQAQRLLSAAFAERRVAKRYVAVVAGMPDDDAGEIALPLICDWPNRPRQMVDHAFGKPALTRWRVLSRHPSDNSARVELEPVTGARTSCVSTCSRSGIRSSAMNCMRLCHGSGLHRGCCCTPANSHLRTRSAGKH